VPDKQTFLGVILIIMGVLVYLFSGGPLPQTGQAAQPSSTNTTPPTEPTPQQTEEPGGVIAEPPPTETPTSTPAVRGQFGPNLIADIGGFEAFLASPAQIAPGLGVEEREADGSHVHPVGWREWYHDKNYDDEKSPAPFREGYDPFPLPDGYPQGRNNPRLVMGRPEFTSARDVSDERRVYSGDFAAQFFCFFRTCRGGYYTQINLPENAERCRASVQFQGSVGVNTDLSNPDVYLTMFPFIEISTEPPLRGGRLVHAETWIVTAEDGDQHFYDQWMKLETSFDVPPETESVYLAIGALANFPSQNDMYFDEAVFQCSTSAVATASPEQPVTVTPEPTDIDLLPTPTPRIPVSEVVCEDYGADVSSLNWILSLLPATGALNVRTCPDTSSPANIITSLVMTDNPVVLRLYTPDSANRWVYIYTVRFGEEIEGWAKQIDNGVELARIE